MDSASKAEIKCIESSLDNNWFLEIGVFEELNIKKIRFSK